MNTLEIIRNSFKDKRDMFEINKNLFLLTKEAGLVKFQFYFGDITPEVLAEITEECETLWKEYGLPIFHYSMLDSKSRVTVPEGTIKSEADFTIKVAMMKEDPISIMLKIIEEKINENSITEMDINALHIIPMMADENKKTETKIKTEELLNRIIQ